MPNLTRANDLAQDDQRVESQTSLCHDCLVKESKRKSISSFSLKNWNIWQQGFVFPHSNNEFKVTSDQHSLASGTIFTFHIFSHHRGGTSTANHPVGVGWLHLTEQEGLQKDKDGLRALHSWLSLSENPGMSMAALKESCVCPTLGCGDGF